MIEQAKAIGLSLGLRLVFPVTRATVFVAEVGGVPTAGVALGGGSVVLGSIWQAGRGISGGLTQIFRTAQRLPKGRHVGVHGDLTKVLRGTGSQSHHLNQAAAFRNIPHSQGIATNLGGNAFSNGSGNHNLFHAAMNASWRKLKESGRTTITNAEYDEVLANALRKANLAASEVDALVEMARAASSLSSLS